MIEKHVHIVIPSSMDKALRSNLKDRTTDGKESFALILAGKHDSDSTERLLGRTLIIPEMDCYESRSGGLIRLHSGFDEYVLTMAEKEKLAIIQVHTHLTDSIPYFSPVDDHSEGERASAIKAALGLDLASIVFDRSARSYRARKWNTNGASGVEERTATIVSEASSTAVALDETDCPGDLYDRQVRAFGRHFQSAASKAKVGIVGLGGMGNALIASLSRLGVKHFVLVDPDRLEESNLNRMIGARFSDARKGRSKVSLATSLVKQVHGKDADVKAFRCEAETKRARKALANCHIIVAATDNHSSRLFLQKLATAYYRPIVHAGVGLEGANGKISRIIGRVASPPVAGDWCLFCGGIIDPELAGKESGDPEHLRMWKANGYLKDTPDPAVMWVNNMVASRAVATIHNLIYPFRNHRGGEDVYIDLLSDGMLAIDHPKTGLECPLCSPEGLRGLGDSLWEEIGHKGQELSLGDRDFEGDVSAREEQQ